jgi:hypothetical protein
MNEEKLTKKDFKMIKERATHMYLNTHFPRKFNNSADKIKTEESANYCLMVCTMSFLKAKGYLEEMPKFDLEEMK